MSEREELVREFWKKKKEEARDVERLREGKKRKKKRKAVAL